MKPQKIFTQTCTNCDNRNTNVCIRVTKKRLDMAKRRQYTKEHTQKLINQICKWYKYKTKW